MSSWASSCLLGAIRSRASSPLRRGCWTGGIAGAVAVMVTEGAGACIGAAAAGRATAGAVLSLPIFHCSRSDHFDQHQCAVLASESPSSESMPIREIRSIPARTVVAVGNESRGLAKRTLDSAALRVHIPLQGNVDSLNVAVAAAIVLFHLSGLPREP